jgi:MFS family permease
VKARAGVKARARLWATLRAQPRPIWALLAGTAVNKAGDFLQLFVVLMVLHRGQGGLLAAAVLACYGAGQLIGVAGAGFFSDRYGPRGVVVTTMAVNAAAVVVLPLLPAVALCAAAGIAGAAANAYRPASAALLAVLVPAGQRVPVFALQRVALNAGVTVAPLLGAVLAGFSFQLLFAVDALSSAIFAIVAAVSLPRHDPAAARGERAAGRRASPLRDRPFALYCAAMLLNAAVYIQYLAVLPIVLHRARLPIGDFAIMITLNAIVVLALEVPLCAITTRLPPRRVIVTGIALVGAGEILYGVSGALAVLIAGTLVWSLGEAFATPVQGAFAVTEAPPGRQGSYAATAAAAATVGYAIGPAAGAWLLVAAGPRGWSLTCAAVAALAGLTAAAGKRPDRRIAAPAS